MANTLETIRSTIMTPLRRRRLGLNSKDYLIGHPGSLMPIEDFDASTGTSATPYGMTRCVSTTGTNSYTLQAPPYPGIVKTLVLGSSSTGGQQFTATSATIYKSSDGTSSAVVNLYTQGASVQLVSETTAKWRVIGGSLNGGSTTAGATVPLVTYTTST